jgi:hypothetical protein
MTECIRPRFLEPTLAVFSLAVAIVSLSVVLHARNEPTPIPPAAIDPFADREVWPFEMQRVERLDLPGLRLATLTMNAIDYSFGGQHGASIHVIAGPLSEGIRFRPGEFFRFADYAIAVDEIDPTARDAEHRTIGRVKGRVAYLGRDDPATLERKPPDIWRGRLAFGQAVRFQGLTVSVFEHGPQSTPHPHPHIDPHMLTLRWTVHRSPVHHLVLPGIARRQDLFAVTVERIIEPETAGAPPLVDLRIEAVPATPKEMGG